MPAERLDRIGTMAFIVGCVLIFGAGAGWAYYGSDIFIATVMAGLAYCF